MKLKKLLARVTNKDCFPNLGAFVDFALAFLDFAESGLQAVIVSKNEPHYNFWQFKGDGGFNVSRPLNSQLIISPESAEADFKNFQALLSCVRDSSAAVVENRHLINRAIYSLQQCIGVALDALPTGKSNTARKLNGDLFETLIRLTLQEAQVPCVTGVVKIPVRADGETLFEMNYQHDLIIKDGDLVKLIGSVKTSSKDRIDKVFLDKFLFNRLTSAQVPHVAIFLNDVQRKNSANLRDYGVSTTFLPGHFKAYTVKLNPLDGVYYFDIRPNMRTESILKDHIRTFDHFIFDDVWTFLDREGIPASMS